MLVLTGAAGASVVGATNVIYQGTKSGLGAYVLVGVTKLSPSYILEVTTVPTGLPINVSWSLKCGNSAVHSHSPFRRQVHCPTLGDGIDVLAQISNPPAVTLSPTASPIAGHISLVVSG